MKVKVPPSPIEKLNLKNEVVNVGSWADIQSLKNPCFIDFRSFVEACLEHTKENVIKLTAWNFDADEYELPEKIFHEQNEALGAVTLDGNSFVFYYDKDDGYRSHSSNILILPGETLKNSFPAYDVRAKLSELISEGEKITNENEMIDFTVFGSDDVAFSVGTEFFDSYYPGAHFFPDPTVLEKHKPEASRLDIKKNLVSLRKRPTQKSPTRQM